MYAFWYKENFFVDICTSFINNSPWKTVSEISKCGDSEHIFRNECHSTKAVTLEDGDYQIASKIAITSLLSKVVTIGVCKDKIQKINKMRKIPLQKIIRLYISSPTGLCYFRRKWLFRIFWLKIKISTDSFFNLRIKPKMKYLYTK